MQQSSQQLAAMKRNVFFSLFFMIKCQGQNSLKDHFQITDINNAHTKAE